MRFLPLAALGVAAAFVFATGAYRYLTLDALKEHRAALEAFVEGNLVFALILYAVAYVSVTALSLPGATIMSLLGGFLFGPVVGTAAVVVAATIGAAIIFSAAKTAVGNALRSRAGPFARKMEEGFRRNAFSYLLLLRLIPLFPFFIVNIAPALFNVRLRTFVAATFIGIIPGAFAFVSAGAGLGAVLDAGDEVKLTGLLTQPAVLTPIIALSLLALLPIAARKLGLLKSAQSESLS
ncbi:MAG TPA: VTT domain-containing protein [Parvularculaceae bacterium]|nr:VTT domain-containing protein [Parvularculaceae bacterium]